MKAYQHYRKQVLLKPKIGSTSKKLQNNTYIKLRNNKKDVCIQLHQTDVITYKEDGSIILDSGGWKTMTTKDRVSTYLPGHLRIYQENHEWYVVNRDTGETVVFADGMRIDPEGNFHGVSNQAEVEERKELRENIRKYAKTFVNKFLDGEIPPPSGGDCWGCALQTKEGKTMGDLSGNSHLFQHLEEQYFVPSLFQNAMLPAAQSGELSRVAASTIHSIWVDKDPEAWNSLRDVIARQMNKVLIDYLEARML